MRTIQDEDTFFKKNSLSASLQGLPGSYQICFSSKDYNEERPYFFIQKIHDIYEDLKLKPCIDGDEDNWLFASFVGVPDDLVLDFIIKFNNYYKKSLDKNEILLYNY
jgi:hypothetical protein